MINSKLNNNTADQHMATVKIQILTVKFTLSYESYTKKKCGFTYVINETIFNRHISGTTS